MVKIDLRRGLNKVVDAIGTDYKLPQGEFLESEFGLSTTCRNPFHGQTPTKVKFSFGTQKELNIWLNEHTSSNDKYPLIWLTYPIHYTRELGNKQSNLFKSLRFIIAINNEIDVSAEQRVSTTEYILQQVSDKFMDLILEGDVASELYSEKKGKVDLSIYINYTSSGANDYVIQSSVKQPSTLAVDNWDTYTLDLDISLRREDC